MSRFMLRKYQSFFGDGANSGLSCRILEEVVMCQVLEIKVWPRKEMSIISSVYCVLPGLKLTE